MLFTFLRRLMLFSLFLILFADVNAQDPGDVIWTKYYGAESYEEANTVIMGHDSGYIFVGTTQSYGLDRWSNAFIGKTLPSGDSLFTFHFGGIGSDVLTDVIKTSDGNYVAVGFSDSEIDFEQGYIVKFNDEGDTLWTKTYGGPVKEILFSVIETDDNGLMIAGLTSSTGAGGEDVWLLRTNSFGDTLWTKTHGTAGNDMAFGMCKTSDGAFAITGLFDFAEFLIMKVDTAGNNIWTNAFGGNDFEEGISIIEDDNGDLLALGHTSSSGAGELDVLLVRVNSSGGQIFTKTYGTGVYEEGRDIIKLNNDEFIIAGNTTVNSTSGMMDYYIISVDSAGEINWSTIEGGDGPDRCYDLLNNGDGNFLIAGSNSVGGELEDAALTLMAGDMPTSVDDPVSKLSYHLYEAYPNPFNPSTIISYSIPNASVVSLIIYDVLGNEIAELFNEFKNEGYYSFTLNTADYKLSSGVYFYTLTADNFIETKKLVLMK